MIIYMYIHTYIYTYALSFSFSDSGESLLLCLLHDVREAGRGITQREQALLRHGDLQLSLQLRLEAAETLRKS